MDELRIQPRLEQNSWPKPSEGLYKRGLAEQIHRTPEPRMDPAENTDFMLMHRIDLKEAKLL